MISNERPKVLTYNNMKKKAGKKLVDALLLKEILLKLDPVILLALILFLFPVSSTYKG